MIYAVGYNWADMCNCPIFITEFISEDFNEVKEFMANHKNTDWVIKKWSKGKVVGEVNDPDDVEKNNKLSPAE